jgi:acetyl esterase/lipase
MSRLLLLLLSFWSVAAPAEVNITRDIHYGPSPEQIVDVYQPDQCKSKPCPVTIWVHGGGWRYGDSNGKRSTAMQSIWAEQGIVIVGVNYRLAPRNQHPAQIEDVASAISWVHDHISQFGGIPNRVSLLGHSAGAHLVALVATNPAYLGAHRLTPKGAIANVFPIDTASFDLTHPSRPVARMVKSTFGTNENVLREASPIWNVVSGGSYPPFYIAATRARQDAVETSEELSRKLKAAGTPVEFITMDYPGVGQLRAHGMIAIELTKVDSRMTKALMSRVLQQP